MKIQIIKSFTFAALVFIANCFSAQAQDITSPAKGLYIGGSMFIHSNSESALGSNSYPISPGTNVAPAFGIEPYIGMDINTHFSVGVDLLYTSNINPYAAPYNNYYYYSITHAKTIGIAPFIRVQKNITDHFRIFLQTALAYTRTTYDAYGTDISGTGYYNTNTMQTVYSLVLSPGIQWFATNRIVLLGSLGNVSYSNSSSTTNGSNAAKSVNDLKVGLSTGLIMGMSYYISRN